MKKLPSREKVLSHDHTWIVVKEKLEFRTPLVSLPGKSHGHRSLVSCSPWGRKESGLTEQLTLFFFLLVPHSLQGSPTRDRTWALAVEAWGPSRWTAREFPGTQCGICAMATGARPFTKASDMEPRTNITSEAD